MNRLRAKIQYLDSFQGFNIQNVVGVVQRGFLVVKWWKSHSFEVSTITFFTSHHDPHASPLCQVDGLDDPGDLVDKGNGAGDVVQHGHVANLGYAKQNM